MERDTHSANGNGRRASEHVTPTVVLPAAPEPPNPGRADKPLSPTVTLPAPGAAGGGGGEETDAAFERLVEIVHAEIERTPDNARAVAAVASRLTADRPFFDALAWPLILRHIRKIVNDCRHHARNAQKARAVRHYVTPGHCRRPASAIAAAAPMIKGAMRDLLDGWVVPGLGRLRELTGAQLDELAREATTNSAGVMANAIFYRSLRQLVGDDETVGQCVSERRAIELLASAQRKVRMLTE